jgi:hypothetical protein
MIKSTIIITERQINFINYSNFGLTYLDLRGEQNVYEILPSLLYNHILIIGFDRDIVGRLNCNGIGFTEVYLKDSRDYFYSLTLNYMNNKISLNEPTLDYKNYHEYIRKSVDNKFISGWNSNSDYFRFREMIDSVK